MATEPESAGLPETIYLLDMGDEWAWCDMPDPDHEDRSAIKYVRAEHLEALIAKSESARATALEEAIAACQRVAVKLDAHYEEFGFGVSNGHIEASGALMCRAALEDLAEPHPEPSDE